MKLYAVTKGEYSDDYYEHSVITVTANKEKAKRIAKLYADDWWETRVEEFEDGVHGGSEQPLWQVNLYKDGHTRCYRLCDGEELGDGEVEILHYGAYEAGLLVVVSAINKKRAEKIAHDKFAEYKAMQEGI